MAIGHITGGTIPRRGEATPHASGQASVAPTAFESALARAVGRPSSTPSRPPSPPLPEPSVVRGVASGEVRGAVAPTQPPPPQFSAEDETLLLALAARDKAPTRRAQPAKTSTPAPSASQTVAHPAEGEIRADPAVLAQAAQALLGRPYTPGGESPRRGFDCSGLTSYVYGKHGLDLPRSSREQFREGRPVPRENLQAGDLVFFGKKGVNHVGIYLEDGRFVHAATASGEVKVGSLEDPVWSGSYAGARRII